MTEKPASAEYQRFLESIDGRGPNDRERLDIDALLALKGDERKAAEDLLIERVQEEDDWRVPPAIAALRLKRAVRPMKEALPESNGKMKIGLARALVDLGALESIDGTVVEMLEEGDPDEGIVALAAADELEPNEALVRALARASVHHESPDVRINAGAGLIYLSKLTQDPLVWEYRPLYLLLGEEDEQARREAFAKIAELTSIAPELADEPVGGA